MRAAEQLVAPKGHLVLQVFKGDVERKPLTPEQVRENGNWREFGIHPDWPVVSRSWTPEKRMLVPVHAGEIVSTPLTLDEISELLGCVDPILESDNLVTTVGKQLILERLSGIGSEGPLTHMGVGASATAAAVGDTQLGTTPTLLAFDSTPTRNSLTTTHIRTFATGEANVNWQEIALFNGGTNGTDIMFNRIAPIGAFNKTSSVSIAATVTITQS